MFRCAISRCGISTLPGAKAVGTVKGSPVAVRTFFLGFEHPLSTDQRGRFARAMLVAAATAGARGANAGVLFGDRGDCGGATAARVPRLRGGPAGASVSHFPSLQQLVRPGIFQPLRRGRRARPNQSLRHGVESEARRDARFVSLRRWLGRSRQPLEFPLGIPQRIRERRQSRGVLRRGNRRVDVAMGRLRRAERGAREVWQRAGIRDRAQRVRALGSEVLCALSRSLRAHDRGLQGQSVQDRRHRQRQQRWSRAACSTAISTRRSR